MKLAKPLLWINATLFAAFGLGFLVAPAFFANLITGAVPSTSNALTDIRATYGGISLGLGIFWGWCARERNTLHAGLLSSLLVLAITAFGRIVGMIVDGSPNIFMFALLAAEMIVGGLFVFVLRKL